MKVNWFLLLPLILISSLSSLFCQSSSKSKFDFGFSSGINVSQIDGDNLRGFNRVGFQFALLGGIKLDARNNLIVSFNYENIGSKKNSEPTPANIERALVELDINKVSLFFGYSWMFNENWEGHANYKLTTGIKLNQVVSYQSEVNNIIQTNPRVLRSNDLISSYLSFRLGLGRRLAKNLFCDFSYEHSLINLLKSDDVTFVSRLSPYYLSLDFSYYIRE